MKNIQVRISTRRFGSDLPNHFFGSDRPSSILIALLIVPLLFSGCIGTDLVDEPADVVPARVTVVDAVNSLLVNESYRFRAEYYDTLGVRVENVGIQWESDDIEIATVYPDGEVVGLSPGQARITATALGVQSIPVLVTVVADAGEVARVVVTPEAATIRVGETQSLTAEARDHNGMVLESVSITWQSSDPGVATVDGEGTVTAVASGSAEVVASAGNIESDPVMITVPGEQRIAMLTPGPIPADRAVGTVILEEKPEGGLLLRFDEDFQSTMGPDVQVFLANMEQPGDMSLNLGKLKQLNGSHTYEVPDGTGIDDFDWVILYCVPFKVVFGNGMFK